MHEALSAVLSWGFTTMDLNRVPGIGRTLGERCNSQASATCMGVAKGAGRVEARHGETPPGRSQRGEEGRIRMAPGGQFRPLTTQSQLSADWTLILAFAMEPHSAALSSWLAQLYSRCA
jgi:hypothetical protein